MLQRACFQWRLTETWVPCPLPLPFGSITMYIPIPHISVVLEGLVQRLMIWEVFCLKIYSALVAWAGVPLPGLRERWDYSHAPQVHPFASVVPHTRSLTICTGMGHFRMGTPVDVLEGAGEPPFLCIPRVGTYGLPAGHSARWCCRSFLGIVLVV